jgi:hypothetical protein
MTETGEIDAYLTTHHGGIAAEFKKLATLEAL